MIINDLFTNEELNYTVNVNYCVDHNRPYLKSHLTYIDLLFFCSDVLRVAYTKHSGIIQEILVSML